ncbi:hypothetical protein Pa4123_75390 [Phytohabitans aurantiacus]|uniref:Uncharacterized protein n=1 Tax=Phytohabitans aurantiacus TaxID=3016789 RepID=A0ABQ5R6S6_9ACTN|nr:hypothetical protein Pa4123_75390 [Phytohabitans aurantiacus]
MGVVTAPTFTSRYRPVFGSSTCHGTFRGSGDAGEVVGGAGSQPAAPGDDELPELVTFRITHVWNLLMVSGSPIQTPGRPARLHAEGHEVSE